MRTSELNMRKEFYRGVLIRKILADNPGSPVSGYLKLKIKAEDIIINLEDTSIFTYNEEEFILSTEGTLYSMKTLT